MSSFRLVASLACLALAPVPAAAGLVLQGRAGKGEGGPSVVELDGRRMRIESGTRHDDLMIFDGDGQRMYQVDVVEKTYRVIDEASAKAVGEKLSAQLAGLPLEVRERMKATGLDPAATEARPKHTWSIEKTGSAAKVAGHECEFYRVLEDGVPQTEGDHRTEVCLIPWSGDLRREDFAAWPELGKFLEKTLGAMTSGLGPEASRGLGEVGGALFGTWTSAAPGFPGQSVRVDSGGKRTVEWELTSIERRPVPRDRFLPPPGYRQVPVDGAEPVRKHPK